MSTRRSRSPALVLAVIMSSGRSDQSIVPSGGRLAAGTWGGPNAGVIVTDSTTHVHLGCTSGDFDGEIILDGEGRFTVAGSYRLRVFPVAIGPSLPAQFSGQVVGRTLTLAVAVNDTVEKTLVALGPATVVHRREPDLGPCPICRMPPASARSTAPPP